MESNMIGLKSNIHRISIAPMMEITNHHFRTMMRLLTRETVLYTEMMHHDTIIYTQKGSMNHLTFDLDQKPIVIQLGGNNIEFLEKIAGMCKESNYDEINLNCGCPSSRVAEGNFGACLMKNPELVAEITKKMREASNLEVTVKCRLGLNKYDPKFLNDFISTVNKEGQVNHFIMHARLAMMNLDTDKNRKIPPLQYDTVYQLKKDYPNLLFSINGGIKSLEEIEDILSQGDLTGCMIGRAAYDNPWLFADVDRRFYNKKNPGLSRKEIIYRYSDYCEKQHNQGVHHKDLFKPLANLFNGERCSSKFRNLLHSYNIENNIADHLKYVIETFEKINVRAVNKLPIVD